MILFTKALISLTVHRCHVVINAVMKACQCQINKDLIAELLIN